MARFTAKGLQTNELLNEFNDWLIKTKENNNQLFLNHYQTEQQWFRLASMLIVFFKDNKNMALAYYILFKKKEKENKQDDIIKQFTHFYKQIDKEKPYSINFLFMKFKKEGFEFASKEDNKLYLTSLRKDIPQMLKEQNIYLIEDKYTKNRLLHIFGKDEQPTEEVFNSAYNIIQEIYNIGNKLDIRDYIRDSRHIETTDDFTLILEDNMTNNKSETDKFLKAIKTDNDKAFADCFLDWQFGVFRNVYTTDYYKYILIFKGNTNGGKSHTIKQLISPFTKYKTENFYWKADDKDDLIALATNIFIVDDELAATKKADIEAIKKVTSMDSIKIRKAYAHEETEHKRIASFIGSTNADQFFIDDTGAHRFLGFEIIDKDREVFDTIDFKKVWGHAYYKWQSIKNDKIKSDIWNTKIENYLQELNEVSRVITTDEEWLIKYYEKDDEFTTQASDIISFLQFKHNSRVNNISLSKMLKQLGYSKKRKSKGIYYNIKRIEEVLFEKDCDNMTEEEIDIELESSKKQKISKKHLDKLLDAKNKKKK